MLTCKAQVMVQGPRLTVSGLDVADLQLQATASPPKIMLELLTTRVAGTRVSVGGRVPFQGPVRHSPAVREHCAPRFCAIAKGAQLDMCGSINLGQEHLNIAIDGTSPLAVVGARIPGARKASCRQR
jgi:hypothetical protein